MEILQLTPSQLRQAANVKERIEGLQQELESILGATTDSKKLHWSQTPAGRAKLRRSARLRWGNRGGLKSSGNGQKVHWTQTPEGKAKMAKLMKRRWKKRRVAAVR